MKPKRTRPKRRRRPTKFGLPRHTMDPTHFIARPMSTIDRNAFEWLLSENAAGRLVTADDE